MSEMNKNQKRLRARRSGTTNPIAWGIVGLVFVFVMSWRFAILASRPAHLKEIASETGALGEFFGTPCATADGSRIAFFRGTETGGGFFFCDTASGLQKLLYEDSGDRRHQVLGWSPDGKRIAFSGTKNDKDALLICNTDSGNIEATIVTYSPVKEFAWLSPSSFVFLKGSTMLNTAKGGLLRVDLQRDLNWGQSYAFAQLEKPKDAGTSTNLYVPIKGLFAMSDNSVAWHARNRLWKLKSETTAPTKLWEGAPTNRIMECDYSSDTGAFLLFLARTNGGYLACFSPGTKAPVDLTRVNNLGITNVVWVNQGKGYAYLLNQSGSHSIFIKADSADQNPIRSVSQDGVRVFIPGGSSIYAIGCLENQPKGVVEYEVPSGSAKYLVSTSMHFRYAKNLIPTEGVLTNSLGEMHAYRIWAPVNFNPQKKYPVVLAQGIRLWNEYAEAMANVGGYYVTVERPEFNHPQIEHLPEDIMAAYQVMVTNPNVNTNHVYLHGASEETQYIARLLNEKPTLWKGTILTSPLAFPDLAAVRSARFLINCGKADEYHMFESVKEFQSNAAHAGVSVTVSAHHTGHVFVSSSANEESTQEFLRFIFE